MVKPQSLPKLKPSRINRFLLKPCLVDSTPNVQIFVRAGATGKEKRKKAEKTEAFSLLNSLCLPQLEHHLHTGCMQLNATCQVWELDRSHRAGALPESSRKAAKKSSSLSPGQPHAGSIPIFKSLTVRMSLGSPPQNTSSESNHPLLQELPPNPSSNKNHSSRKIHFHINLFQFYLSSILEKLKPFSKASPSNQEQ